ncbi:MAG: heme NO-binding domain-containing protein [Akkermansiaceae bacterium]|jgi:hypothetical protein|nr:heme NO-binding domain-containing protein [Akkermansiaceae bacterium]
MKGIVFTEFLEMIEARHDGDFADDLIVTAGLPHDGAYTAVGTYPHTEMVALVVRYSAMSEIPVPEVLKGFGRHLFERFAVLYPVFFDQVRCPLDFLGTIEDVIHVEVRKLYPDAELPRFDAVRPEPGVLELTYRSERHLADLAEGLIEGCVKHFGVPHEIERGDAESDGSVRFRIRKIA